MTAPVDPPVLRPVPSVQRRPNIVPQSTTNPATLALQDQLVDGVSSTRGDLDPLGHLGPPPLTTPSAGVVPLAARRGAGSDDGELADLFSDGPEGGPAEGPSLLDPERKLSDDPLALLHQQPAELQPARQLVKPVDVDTTPPPVDIAAQRQNDVEARPEPAPLPNGPRAPIIPDDWDPGLNATARTEAVPAPRSVPSLPTTGRLLPLPPLRQEGPAAIGDAAPPPLIPLAPLVPPAPLASPASVTEAPADNSVDQAMVLLRRREAAREPKAGDADLLGASTATDGQNLVQDNVPRTLPFSTGREASAPGGAVLDGLWQALGIDPSRISEADQRRLLAELGQTIREIADGLIQILAARQHLKSEFRVDQTVLRATENNLFKFTRNADELLSLAMSNRNRVFMPMDQAAREALNDIKAHELATLAAVQLSIRAVLDRFHPSKLARQADEQPRGRFDWIKLRSMKARCWDFFTSMYGNLSADADEASNRIFTAEFGRAYRERIEQRRTR